MVVSLTKGTMAQNKEHEMALKWVNDSYAIIMNPWNHARAMKNESFIPSLLYFMDEHEDEVTLKAMEIAHLLAQNPKNHPYLCNSVVFVEGIKYSYHKHRKGKRQKSYRHMLAHDVMMKLKDVHHEMNDGELHPNDVEDKDVWGDTTLMFNIPQLCKANVESVLSVLMQVSYVNTCSMDLAFKMATVTVRDGFSSGLLKKTVSCRLMLDIETVDPSSGMLQICNMSLSNFEDETSGPAYLSEMESPVKSAAVTARLVNNLKDTATGFVGWFQKSFYW